MMVLGPEIFLYFTRALDAFAMVFLLFLNFLESLRILIEFLDMFRREILEILKSLNWESEPAASSLIKNVILWGMFMVLI